MRINQIDVWTSIVFSSINRPYSLNRWYTTISRPIPAVAIETAATRSLQHEALSGSPTSCLQMNGTRPEAVRSASRPGEKYFSRSPRPGSGDANGRRDIGGGDLAQDDRAKSSLAPPRRRDALAQRLPRAPRGHGSLRQNDTGRTGRPAGSGMLARDFSGLRSRPVPRSRWRRAARRVRRGRSGAPGRSSLRRRRPR